MLSTPAQLDAAGGGEKEKFGDPTEFHKWAGRGVADIILPEIKEDPLAAKVKALEAKVADSEYKNAELTQKVAASESRIAKLEQTVSLLLHTETTQIISYEENIEKEESKPGGNLLLLERWRSLENQQSSTTGQAEEQLTILPQICWVPTAFLAIQVHQISYVSSVPR